MYAGLTNWNSLRDVSYRQNPKVEMLSRTWAPSVLGYPFVLRCFCLNFGAFGFGLPLRFTGFWHEITRRLLAEVQHFACRSCHVPWYVPGLVCIEHLTTDKRVSGASKEVSMYLYTYKWRPSRISHVFCLKQASTFGIIPLASRPDTCTT